MTLEEQEQRDEELADYEVGFHDRLICEPWEASPGDDLVLAKGMTDAQRWERLKAIHAAQRRELGPGWARGWDAAHQEYLDRA